MIGTVVRVAWINLKRDHVAQGLTFLLPIVFFTIFALIVGTVGRGGTAGVRVAVVDEDGSDFSRGVVSGLQGQRALRLRTSVRPGASVPLNRAQAENLVRRGEVPAAIVLPPGLGAAFGGEGPGVPIRVLSDAADPVAAQIVQGLLQKVVMTAAPDLLVKRGLDQFARYGGGLSAEQRRAVDTWLSRIGPGHAEEDGQFGQAVEVVDVLGGGRQSPVAFYAAGIGVMFLLFACAAAGGSLIEEVESGTLERLLTSRLTMRRLLLGKWLFVTLLGIAQIVIMFAWAALVFKLPLLPHLPGFLLMTVATSAAAAGFGLTLATACRSRAQLSGLSTIVILTMSALGGSMFPRFLMSETVQRLGLVTFNAWALDGYLKVFWRGARLWELWPQLIVLAGLTVAFLALARVLARRWETV